MKTDLVMNVVNYDPRNHTGAQLADTVPSQPWLRRKNSGYIMILSPDGWCECCQMYPQTDYCPYQNCPHRI